jgi:hypothetical protein
MTVVWAYGKEAANGRVSGPAAACLILCIVGVWFIAAEGAISCLLVGFADDRAAPQAMFPVRT